ncbi:hypothetical protein H9L39_12787 [Fusarium oxysporum f. sp. albedinis]|nr:hypothetical protein H9L39_12787 [Fusarium oxysporum f. sp. albedinis]
MKRANFFAEACTSASQKAAYPRSFGQDEYRPHGIDLIWETANLYRQSFLQFSKYLHHQRCTQSADNAQPYLDRGNCKSTSSWTCQLIVWGLGSELT